MSGELSFDALIQFSPFQFVVEIRGSASAEAYSVSVSLRIRLSLSGPTPWDARGRASFEVCCHDIDIDVHKTWGRRDKVRLPSIDPLPVLIAALNRPESWSSVLPPMSVMVEALRPPEPPSAVTGGTAAGTTTAPAPILVHPTGTLEVRQKVVPLNVRLETFANAPIKDHNAFRLVPGAAGASVLQISARDELFGRAQFEELSDSEKLSIPSFEKMQGGVAIGTEQSGAYGTAVPHPLRYECILVGEDGTDRPQARPALGWKYGGRLLRGGAAHRSPLRSSGRRRFERLGVRPKVTVLEDNYVVARRSTLAVVVSTVPGRNRGLTRMEADRALEKHVGDHPADAGQLVVLLAHEAA